MDPLAAYVQVGHAPQQEAILLPVAVVVVEVEVVNQANPAELVQGVENLKIYYGLDNDGDGVADQYFLPTQLEADQWPEVVVARVEITMRSRGTVDGNYLNRTFTATVQLRNRGLNT